MNLLESIYFVISDRNLYEMANVQPKESGLVAIVHVMSGFGSRHAARVKISNVAGKFDPKDKFVVSVESEPRIVVGKSKLSGKHTQDVLDWVKLNREHIVRIWKDSGTMTALDISNGFRSI